MSTPPNFDKEVQKRPCCYANLITHLTTAKYLIDFTPENSCKLVQTDNLPNILLVNSGSAQVSKLKLVHTQFSLIEASFTLLRIHLSLYLKTKAVPVHTAPFSTKHPMNTIKCSHCSGQIQCSSSHFQTNISMRRIPSYSNVSVAIWCSHVKRSVFKRTVFESMCVCLRIRKALYPKRMSVNARSKCISFAPFSFKYGAV